MKFCSSTADKLCRNNALCEPEDSKSRLAEQLSYFSEDMDKILQAKTYMKEKKREAAAFSSLREDLPTSFAASDKLFANSAEKENNCLSIPKII